MAPPSARRRLSAALAHLGTPLSMSACSIAPDDERQRPSYSHHHSSVDYSSAEVEARVEELRAEGWVVLPDCIEPELVPKLIAASDRLMAQEGDGNGIPGEFASIGSLAAKDDVYWQLLDNSNLLAVVRGFLGEDCLLSAGNTRNVHPGSGPTGIHVDEGMYRYTPELCELFPRGPQRTQLMCVAAVALADFAPDNGNQNGFMQSIHRGLKW